jgi:hypothetical protein
VVHNFLDLTLFREVADDKARKGPINLQPLDQNRLRDESEGGHFLQNTIVGGFVKYDSMLCLVLDFAFGPLLFLGGLASARGCWRGGFGLGLLRRKERK